MPSGRWQQELQRRPDTSHPSPAGATAENRGILTSHVEHDDRRGGDPGRGAGQDPEVVLDVQEEVSVVLQDGSGQAGHAERGGDHHPAVTPVRRSGSPGLHLALSALRSALLRGPNPCYVIILPCGEDAWRGGKKCQKKTFRKLFKTRFLQNILCFVSN